MLRGVQVPAAHSPTRAITTTIFSSYSDVPNRCRRETQEKFDQIFKMIFCETARRPRVRGKTRPFECTFYTFNSFTRLCIFVRRTRLFVIFKLGAFRIFHIYDLCRCSRERVATVTIDLFSLCRGFHLH